MEKHVKTNKKNIILIGMPGAGKSTIGVVLAKKAGKNFIDSDILIQEKMGMMLEEIIDNKGIDGFIETENIINQEIVVENSIIATGGSICYCKEALEHFRNIGTVIYLKLPYLTIKERLGDFSKRGVALREDQSLEELYAERVPLYEENATVTLECENKSLKEVVEEIIGFLEL